MHDQSHFFLGINVLGLLLLRWFLRRGSFRLILPLPLTKKGIV
jgi:hypothetical protein